MTRVLALDLATTTGGAAGAVGQAPRSFIWVLKKRDHDQRFTEFGKHLDLAIKTFQPEKIVLEAGFVKLRKNARRADGTAERVLFGLRAVSMFIAGLHGVRVDELTVGEVRKHFLGVVPQGSDEQKRAVQVRCKQLGWPFEDNNAADALALWDCYCANISANHYLANMRLNDANRRAVDTA